ncbi:MAG: hypothetical protein GWP15_01415 [Nitrospirae bacterium]|nr:hypothetical protein [Nitrospirota bacterium]
MGNENHCTSENKECDQIPNPSLNEGQTVWWHIKGLSSHKDADCPQDVGYLDTKGMLGSYLFENVTPKKMAEIRSEREGLIGISHTCQQCRKSLEGTLELWEEIEAL